MAHGYLAARFSVPTAPAMGGSVPPSAPGPMSMSSQGANSPRPEAWRGDRTDPRLVQHHQVPASKQGAMSDLNTSVGGVSTSRQQLGFERRVAWLEEDVSVLHRRLRDECGEGGGGGGGAASGDHGLRALVARLDGELAAERRARESLEARLANLEHAIQSERTEREVQLRAFSGDLEATMRGLISRIDEGVSMGASKMRERTDQTEERLRSLISRVDEGLSIGAAALQDTLSTAGASLDMGAAGARPRSPAGRVRSPVRQASPTRQAWTAGGGSATGEFREPNKVLGPACLQLAPSGNAPGAPAAEQAAPDHLLQSYDQLRQENQRLRERRAQLHGASATPGAGITPSATPSLAFPGTLQVPGSGLLGLLGAAAAGPEAQRMVSRGGAGSPLTVAAAGRFPAAGGRPSPAGYRGGGFA